MTCHECCQSPRRVRGTIVFLRTLPHILTLCDGIHASSQFVGSYSHTATALLPRQRVSAPVVISVERRRCNRNRRVSRPGPRSHSACPGRGRAAAGGRVRERACAAPRMRSVSSGQTRTDNNWPVGWRENESPMGASATTGRMATA